ncbi:MAG TPA: YebC/PmpR family DNA-binding transcriptional regulator, partial [Gemmatimonadales bacterium]|nr:YebC/PmpR family DNA-binding transcriptional regulator [Gemmatimonadales bacterium]
MAGHSKWKQIKHKKAATDAKRGAAFTKLIKEITVAARQGGGDPAGNARLRSAIDAARGANMPSDNIERAIKKGTGELEGVSYEDVVYEGYGPGGAAILLQVTTDNVNRTVAEIRHIFGRYGGNLGAPNSVAWMFDKKGLIFVEAVRYDEDTVLEAALEAGAEDAAREGDDYVVAVEPARVHGVADGLRSRGIQPRESEIAMKPRQSVKVAGADAERLLKLMDALEEHE